MVRPEEEIEGIPSLLSYNRLSPDYVTLRNSFLDFSEKLGFPMNDSQVSIDSSILWPKLHMMLNKNQKSYQSEPLAVFQTHHWGIALESVTEMKDGSKEPFPREKVLAALIKTIYLR